MRVRVARALNNGVVLDEFASCLDHAVVYSLCRGVARFVRDKGLSRVVVASCHPKVVAWLQPDWAFNTDTWVRSRRSVLWQAGVWQVPGEWWLCCAEVPSVYALSCAA